MVVHYNLREQVLNNIGQQIISGELNPGDVLPKEDTLSVEYEVSRTVIREAIKGLAARGMVESRPKVGTIVRPREDWRLMDPQVLEWLATSTSDEAFLLQVANVRLVIEPATAALAARNATEDQIAAMAAAYEELETAVDNEAAWAIADLKFHATIVAACNNELLAYIVRTLRRPLYSKRRINVSLATILKPEDVTAPYASVSEEVLARHRAVLTAIQNHDEDGAREATAELLTRVTTTLRNAS